MIKKLIAGVFALSFGAVFAGAELSGDVFTIDVESGEFETVIPEGAASVVKTGAGKAILTAVPGGTFSGTVTVNAGTLASPSVRYLGGVTKVTVVPGATLDLTDETRTLADNYFTHKTTLEIGGSGVDGQGALVRTKSIKGDDAEGLFCDVTLTADTVFRAGKDSEGGRWTIGCSHMLKQSATITMNSHKLTIYGDCGFSSDSWGGTIALKDPGDIVVADGAVFHIYSLTMNMAGGSKAFDGQTMTFGNNSQLHLYMVRASDNYKWKLVVPEGNTASFLVNGGGGAGRNKWAGDIHVDGTLKVNVKYVDYPQLLLGKITGKGQIWKGGNGTLTLNTNVPREIGSLKQLSMEDGVNAGMLSVSGCPGFTVNGRATLGNGAGSATFENTKTNFFGNLDIARNVDFSNAGLLMITNPATYGPLLSAGTASMRVGAPSDTTPIAVRLMGNTHLCGPDFTKPYTLAIGCDSSGYGKGCVYVSDGASISNSLCIGENSQYGALYLSGANSSVYVAPGGASYRQNIGDAAYGYFSIKDGSVVYRDGYVLLGRNGGRGFFVQESGTATFNLNTLWLARPNASSKSHGEYLLRGGTLNTPGGMTFLNPDSGANFYNASAILTVGGGTLAATVDTTSLYVYGSTNIVGKNETSFNLNEKGLLKCEQMRFVVPGGAVPTWASAETLYRQASKWYVNFNGGTIQAKKAGGFFGDSTYHPTRVTVFEGGATVDTNGKDVTWRAAIEKPYGKRIASVTLPDAAKAVSTVLGATKVLATDGAGAGFTAITDFDEDSRQNTGVVVTCGGFGYEEAPTVVCEQMGAHGVGSWTCSVTMEDAPTTGGFTKKGAGRLTLKGANTWGGTTRIEGGTLECTHAQGLPAGTLIEIDAAALTDPENEPLIAHTYTGGEIHLKGMSASWGKKSVKIATFTTALATAPTIKVFDAEGQDVTSADCKVKLMSDGTVLTFGNVELLSVTNPDAARGSIEPYGNISVTNGEVVTFTATPNNHALVGWNVDGEFVATSDLEYVYTVDAEKGTLSLSPVFSTNLYVDANAKNDDGDGMTPETAKQTLAAIAALAIPGDTIHAAPGTYDKGYSDVVTGYSYVLVNCGASSFSNARVHLTEGLSLVADEGPDVTTIVGYAAPKGQGEAGWEDTGCGPSSLRCVVARANTYLKGFTIKDGYSRGKTGTITDANAGGCILAPDYAVGQRAGTLLVEDCRISNGHSRSGCCVSGGIYVRCVVKNGVSFSSSGPRIGYMARFIDCVLYQNNESMMSSPRGVYNTFAYSKSCLTDIDFSGSSANYPVVNSIIYTAGTSSGTAVLKHFKNCYVQRLSARVSLDEATCENCVVTNGLNYSVDFSMLGFNKANDQPTGLLPTSPLIDAGDSTLVPAECLAGDVDGLQRIWNAKLDIGPFEYVPTNEFSAAICGRHAEVSGASEMTELKDAAIDIPDGETLSITWKGAAAGETAKLTVSALAGNLKVYRGDECILEVDEAGTYEITSVAATTELKFVAEGGKATITGFKPDLPGLILIFK